MGPRVFRQCTQRTQSRLYTKMAASHEVRRGRQSSKGRRGRTALVARFGALGGLLFAEFLGTVAQPVRFLQQRLLFPGVLLQIRLQTEEEILVHERLRVVVLQ